jgi:uncharacterized membrane protein YeaQ/YmgE (transglycosylase-associated protein family)
LRNLVVGLAGALVGGFIFRLFGLLPDLDKIAISLRGDVVAALIGSMFVLAALWIWQKFRARRVHAQTHLIGSVTAQRSY